MLDSDANDRGTLLLRLKSCSPAEAFVLLWSHFGKVGLQLAENQAGAAGIEALLDLPPADNLSSIEQDLAGHIEEPRQFDLLAARWLVALDRQLKDLDADLFELGEYRGLDGELYWLRHRESPLVDLGDPPTWAGDQTHHIGALARYVVAVPRGEKQGMRIVVKRLEEWAGAQDGLLRARMAAEKPSVLVWPLRTRLKYPGLDSGSSVRSLSLESVTNEAELQEEIGRAIEVARQEELAILVLPELCAPPSTVTFIKDELATVGVEGWPVLLIVGKCHFKHDGRDYNHAAVFGPGGILLHEHRKLTKFRDRTTGLGENNVIGNEVTILDSPWGHICILICLDFINQPMAEILRLSHANLFLVPSLSPTTSAHQNSSKGYGISNLAVSFISNYNLELEEYGMSGETRCACFYCVPGRKPSVICHEWADLYLAFKTP